MLRGEFRTADPARLKMKLASGLVDLGNVPGDADCPHRGVTVMDDRSDLFADRNFIGRVDDEPHAVFVDVKHFVVFSIDGEGHFFTGIPLLSPVSQILLPRCHCLCCPRFL